LAIALPAGTVEKALNGLEALYRRGIRYPIPHAGAELDMTSAFPLSYSGLDQLEEIRGKDNRILLGVTGGVASGKTTVVRMLEQLGAPVIDFDLLSRDVVEPGKPAWKEIVAYFGEQVLLEDRTLDRKKLSEVVFRDMEKRKKLEGFIHPRVFEEFIRLVKEVTSKDPNVIIQVDVPLMIEINLQYVFHKVLLVYMPEEMQIERLIKRDRISQEMARNMIRSQLPIEEKKGYADFIVDNSGTLEETRRQVEEIWGKLKEIQRDRSA
jgi:dephospho-CoA kinase